MLERVWAPRIGCVLAADTKREAKSYKRMERNRLPFRLKHATQCLLKRSHYDNNDGPRSHFHRAAAQLQPALASFYTVTSYYVITTTTSQYTLTTCTSPCRTYTYTDTTTVALKPTVTPTVSPTSSHTQTYTYDDLEVVSLYLPRGAVAPSDFITWEPTPTDDNTDYVYTYAIPVTWTAPSSCPTPFTVTTLDAVYIPSQVTPYITPTSTISATHWGPDATRVYAYVTLILDPTAIPASRHDPSNHAFDDCFNPSTTSPGYHSSSTFCSALTGCVAKATWIIVIATLLPTIFVLGLVENYFWFRRLMLGRWTLRVGTVCWCLVSLWCVMLTHNVKARSKEDQVLLRQLWAGLGWRARIGVWLRWGFRHKYPVEVIGSWDGGVSVPVPVVMCVVPPPPSGDGEEKSMGAVAQMQPGYASSSDPERQPYPAQQLHV